MPLSTPIGATLTARVARVVEQHDIPGISLGLFLGGESSFGSYGVTSIVNPLPVDERTLFQIGSVSKVFTALAVLKAVDAKLLDLDRRVSGYLRDFAVEDSGTARLVTVRDLLTHTAGWSGDFILDTGRGNDALQLLVDQFRDLPQVCPRGTRFSYSNSAFSLAGRLLEITHGAAYERVIQDLILDPFGMTQSTFDPVVAMTQRFAVGHARGTSKIEVATPWAIPRSINPAGGLVSSTKEIMRFCEHLLADPPLLQAEDTQASWTTPHFETTGGQRLADHIGLGWMISDRYGPRVLSHSGGTVGQKAQLVVIPSLQAAFCVLSNGSHATVGVDRLTADLINQLTGSAEPVSSTRPCVDLKRYCGTFESSLGHYDIWLPEASPLLQIRIRPKTWLAGSTPSPRPSAWMEVELVTEDVGTIVSPGSHHGYKIKFFHADQPTAIRVEGRIARKIELR